MNFELNETEKIDTQQNTESSKSANPSESNLLKKKIYQQIYSSESLYLEMSSEQFDEIYNYDLSSGRSILKDLEIIICSNKIPRIACANHKINLSVRTVIIKPPIVSKDLILLNSFAV